MLAVAVMHFVAIVPVVAEQAVPIRVAGGDHIRFYEANISNLNYN